MACSKISFSKKEARSVLNRSRLGENRCSGVRAMRVYECEVCGGWHITSKPRLEIARIDELMEELRVLRIMVLKGNIQQINNKLLIVKESYGLLINYF